MRKLYQMRGFFLAYPDIFQTVSGKCPEPDRFTTVQAPSEQSGPRTQPAPSAQFNLATLAQRFPLP